MSGSLTIDKNQFSQSLHFQWPQSVDSLNLAVITTSTTSSKVREIHSGININLMFPWISGQIGDDAYFIARHVDEWSQSDFQVSSSSLLGRQEREPELSPSSPSSSSQSRADDTRVNQDRKGNADVIGVADGVGGWRAYGVDPGLFSNHLMRNCERLVKAGFFVSNSPKALLEQVKTLENSCDLQWITSYYSSLVMHSPSW